MALQDVNRLPPGELKKSLDPEKLHLVFGGGVGAFGRNISIFTYQNKTIWIDAGCGFPNSQLPGLVRTLPGAELVRAFTPDAIIITHAHEDHIGGLPYLKDLIPAGVKVYLSRFSAALLRKRLGDLSIDASHFPIEIIKENETAQCGPFHLSGFYLPHSIPQTFGLGVEIKELGKKIFYSSDFKLQGREPRFSSAAIKKYGPVDYLFCDSTGALSGGSAISEEQVHKNLEKVIQNWKGRIFITTFASQVERIHGIYDIAKSTGRPLGIRGHSIRVHLQAAFESDEFPESPWKLPSPSPATRNAIWLISGCQAEPGSSFRRFAEGELGKLSPGKGDLVIYSGSIIPGNIESVYIALNHIAAGGAHIMGIDDDDPAVHTSGHARKEELKKFISWLAPERLIPIHGDPIHFQGFASILKGNKRTHLEILDERFLYSIGEKVEQIEGIDNDSIMMEEGEVHSEHKLYCHRRNLSQAGICNIVVEQENFRLLALQYVGAGSEEFITSVEEKIKEEIRPLIEDLAGKSSSKENKIKQKICKIHMKYLKKTPYVNIIRA